jgi:hypothetical protein
MTTWPPEWKLCTSDAPIEGLIIPLEYGEADEPGKCTNCHNRELLGFRVEANARTERRFQTASGEVVLHGRLAIGVCPVCTAPKITHPDPETLNGEEPWWNKI